MARPPDARFGPWFHRHPRLAIAASVALFATVTVLRFVAGDERDATLLLLVMPVALVALAFGFAAGAAAAVLSVGTLVAWVVTAGVELSVLGWASRVIPLLLLGLLIGHASDVQRRSAATAARLAIAEERQREAAEINDTIVQRLAVAKWSLEAGNDAAGLEALEEVMESSQCLVVGLLDGLDETGAGRRRTNRAGERRPARV